MLINQVGCADAGYFNELGVERAVEEAFENLRTKVTVYGLQEFYDESLILFAERLGWRLPVYVPRNVGRYSHRLQFDADDLTVIEQLTVADRALYAKVKSDFQKNFPFSVKQLRKLHRLRFVNKGFISLMIAK